MWRFFIFLNSRLPLMKVTNKMTKTAVTKIIDSNITRETLACIYCVNRLGGNTILLGIRLFLCLPRHNLKSYFIFITKVNLDKNTASVTSLFLGLLQFYEAIIISSCLICYWFSCLYFLFVLDSYFWVSSYFFVFVSYLTHICKPLFISLYLDRI